ncbi:hypothetical protein EQ62_14860 [Salmonella enterica subsp. enterica]|nr:hypothetical protein [Salmonella enterica]ECC2865704.1 hypothetical protein [Salmonella enterica subsp. enterica]
MFNAKGDGFFSAAMCGPQTVICGPQTVMCGPDSTHNEAPTLKQRFFVITLTKLKRFFMGAFVGALFTKNTNKTNNKQHVNRGYDSESGTTFQRTQPYGWVFAF